MGLSAILEKSLKNSLQDDQGRWRQYVLDHLDYIAKRTKTYTLSAQVMNRFRYDLKRFLTENLGLKQDISWIVLLLNNLPSDLEFSDPGDYLIPSDELISRLHLSYLTVSKNSF